MKQKIEHDLNELTHKHEDRPDPALISMILSSNIID